MTHDAVLLVVGQVAGGAGRHVHELAAGLTDRGRRVRVACPAVVEQRYDFAGLGVEVVPVEIGDRPHPRADAAAVRALRAAARAVGVVHAHGIRAGALAALAGRRGVPLVVTLHNSAPAARPQRMLFRLLERLVARRAEVVLAVSPDLLEEAARGGAQDVRLAVVASAPPRAPERSTAEVRRELGDPPVLALTVGRLAAQKDLDLLLDATARVDTRLDVQVFVAGDGPDRGRLAERISAERLPVRLLGARDDVPDLLNAADLVISSARWEGQPVWLQEAMHAGCPTVATDVGGTRTIVANAAILVRHGDPRALADAIERVAADPDLREVLAARSRAQARALPDRADAVTAVESVYNEVRRGCRGNRAVDDVG